MGELLPCPFCGDAMQFGVADWFGHFDPDNEACPIAIEEFPPFDLTGRNTRARSGEHQLPRDSDR